MSISLLAPLFISFEGIDGCGKSTLISRFSSMLEEAGIAYLKTREPGGTLFGETIRNVLLDPSFSGIHPWSEVLMYAAVRAQHVKEVIRPALEQGVWVITDRYADATMAYQGYGRGLDLNFLLQIHQVSTGNLWPDVTFLLNCDVTTACHRMKSRQGDPDRLEQEDNSFREKVREGYLSLAEAEPDRFILLDVSHSLDEVTQRLQYLFGKRFNIKKACCKRPHSRSD